VNVRAFVAKGTASPQTGVELELDEEESRYLVKVRRLRVGGRFELLDGRGGAWAATLVFAGRRARVEVGAARPSAPAPEPRVVLLGLPDPTATLDALSGASELGASELVLVRCERSQGHAPSQQRIERVLRAAMRQCGRASPPIVSGAPPEDPWTLAEALAHRPELPGLFGTAPAPGQTSPGGPGKAPPGGRPPPAPGGVRLLIGPEGGLTPAEVGAAQAAGFFPAELGPWVLRTPTAVVALLARSW
jgi:16S rRNA (uracil1498-N3)-methyltransferase